MFSGELHVLEERVSLRVTLLQCRAAEVEGQFVRPVRHLPIGFVVRRQLNFDHVVLGMCPVWLPHINENRVATLVGTLELRPLGGLGTQLHGDIVNAECFHSIRVTRLPRCYRTGHQSALRCSFGLREDIFVVVQIGIGLEIGRGRLNAARGITLNNVSGHIPASATSETGFTKVLDRTVAPPFLDVLTL